MPYEFNPLIPDGFQKKSAVTPADISRVESEISDLQTTTTDLKQKKITKFFSANDYLEDNEIAQYQGEDDAVNNLQNGFFYKKNPAFSIVSNEDSFAYSTAELLNVYDFDNNLALQQYYLDDVNLSSDDYGIIGNNNYFTLVFNHNLFVNNTLPISLLSGFVFYPYLNKDGKWDFDNPVTVQNGNYIYKGNIIQMSPLRFGLMGAVLAASMTSPFYRYLWIYILMETYVGVIAVNFCTNSSNILTALGVVNGLSCFGFLYRTTITPTPRVNFNAQGYDLTENQKFSFSNTEPLAALNKSGLMPKFGYALLTDANLVNSFEGQLTSNTISLLKWFSTARSGRFLSGSVFSGNWYVFFGGFYTALTDSVQYGHFRFFNLATGVVSILRTDGAGVASWS